jgi:beta-lactamase regulating signal transducer with metallopeptidase domain
MILDYIWQSLFLASLSATIYLTVMIGVSFLMRRSSAIQLKWYLNSQILFLFAILAAGFLVAAVDKQILTGCFEKFAKQSPSWIVTRWIAAAWVSGIVLLTVSDLLRAYFVAGNLRGLTRVESGRTRDIFLDLKRELKVRATIDLFQADQAFSPFAYGFFRYKIALPNLEFSQTTLRSALAHELIHVRDRDSLWMALELLCRRILFWHPLVYAFSSVYASAVEKAADEAAVVMARIDKKDFLSALLEMVAFSVRVPTTPLQLNASRSYRETRARIEFLMRRESRPAKWHWLAVILAPVAVSFAQAGTLNKDEPWDPKMCVQVNHEKVIESWLRIEPAPPMKCGK